MSPPHGSAPKLAATRQAVRRNNMPPPVSYRFTRP